MNQILVATDFSAHAARALEWAAFLARKFDAPLELMTSAWVPPVITSEGVPFNVAGTAMPAGFVDSARDRAHAQLEELAKPLRTTGLHVTCTVTLESPSTAIAARAEESQADLIALGTRGLSGLKHVLLGSVAERVARTAPCPVLTAHADSPAPGEIEKILVPTDFSDSGASALELAERIATKVGAELVLQHACHVPVSLESDVWSLDAPVFESLEAEARKQLSALQGRVGVPSEVVVSRGVPDVHIVEQSKREGIGLIVIGTRGRTGLAHLVLGSTAERVIRGAAVPVISVGHRD